MNDLNKRGIYGPQLSYTLPICTETTNDFFVKNKLYGTWYMSEKYDGIRAIWTGQELLTRSWRPFRFVPMFFIRQLPKNIPLDGEIYIPNDAFSNFSSLSVCLESENVINKWKRVKYLIFDTPVKDKTFEQRLNSLEKLKMRAQPNIEIVKFTKLKNIVRDFKLVNEKFNEIVKRKGEGVMLIRASSHYEGRRSRDSLKYKKEYSGEATVVQLCEGIGKNYQRLGKLKCKLKNGKTFYCGTGFTDAERDMYQFDKNICINIKNDTNIIKVPRLGDTITYNCMEIIEKSGIPRMAVYKGLFNS